MPRSDRPRPKSPFAGEGSWNTPAEPPPRVQGSSAPRAPLALLAFAGVAALLAVVVALLLLRAPAAPAPQGAPVQIVAVERSAAPPVTAEPSAPASALAAPSLTVALPAPPSSSAPPAPASSAAADVRKAVRAALPRLKVCYEQALRAYPAAGGEATLRLELGVDGRVTEASVTGATPPSLASCMQKVATTMLFAASDAPRTVSIPVALNSR